MKIEIEFPNQTEIFYREFVTLTNEGYFSLVNGIQHAIEQFIWDEIHYHVEQEMEEVES